MPEKNPATSPLRLSLLAGRRWRKQHNGGDAGGHGGFVPCAPLAGGADSIVFANGMGSRLGGRAAEFEPAIGEAAMQAL